ncbi:Enolase [Chitinispirillum alkaliphilum]|nr:Enolase [Chitinispirillum alkaliphilum]
MARETVVTRFKLIGREILSSYASMTLEGVMTARVARGKDSWTIEERNGIAKGTSDGENEAIYIPNDKAIRSIEKNIAPLLPRRVVIRKPSDILDACRAFDLKLVENAGPNKKKWGGNACLASSTVFFQTLLSASGFKPWEVLTNGKKPKNFYMPNIAFNMVCGGEHVPGTKQDIQEMFFFAMAEKSVKDVFITGTKFFRQFEENLVRDGLPTGTAKERGFVFPVKDNFEGLKRIKECASQLGLEEKDYAIGTDNAFSEIQKGEALRKEGKYDLRFSGEGVKTREELVEFDYSVVKSAKNFVTMEDPGSEHDLIAHKLMNEKYGDRTQIVLDDIAVTQMRFIIPFLAAEERKDRAGNSVLIKLNQAGTFYETLLASQVVLGVADAEEVEEFLRARKDIRKTLSDLKSVGVKSIEEALENIKNGGFTAFFSHRSTEGSSEFLPLLPLMFGSISRKVWFKAGAPNGERNLQNYNPLIRAEEAMIDQGINVEVAGFEGLPEGVEIPALKK